MLQKMHENIRVSSFPFRVVSTVAIFLAFSATVGFGQNGPGLTMPPNTAPRGAMVTEVTPDGPAEKAGISPHDIITAVDGTAVQSPRQIVEDLARHKPGDTMELTVAQASDGTTSEVTLTLGANPHEASQPYMGLSVRAYILLVPEDGGAPGQKQVPPGI
ncbi:MAG: PDZ domain-containing protein [Spirochaetia bacterium]